MNSDEGKANNGLSASLLVFIFHISYFIFHAYIGNRHVPITAPPCELSKGVRRKRTGGIGEPRPRATSTLKQPKAGLFRLVEEG